MTAAFDHTYPHIARWVKQYGWIELGQDEFGTPLTRAMDASGIVWEAKDPYPTVEEALQAMEVSLADWLSDLG